MTWQTSPLVLDTCDVSTWRDAHVARQIDAAHAHEHRDPLWLRVVKRVVASLFWAAVAAVVALALLVFVIPQAKAGAGLTVLTGSMQPAINPGDVVAVRGIKPHEVCDTLGVGDIVTFMPNEDDPTLVTHRVIAINRGSDAAGPGSIGEDMKYEYCTVQTKGDDNNVVDEPVPSRAVKGVHMYTVPKVGHVLNATQNVASMRAVSIAVAVVLFAVAGAFLVNRYGKAAPRHSHLTEPLGADSPDETWDTLSGWQDDDYSGTRLAQLLPTMTGQSLRDWTADNATARLLRTSDGLPVAYVLTHRTGTSTEIVHIGVDPQRRNAGWGSCMLDSALDDAFLSGAELVWARHGWHDTASDAMFDTAGFAHGDGDDLAVRVLDVATWCGRNATREAPTPCDLSDVEGGARDLIAFRSPDPS